MATLKQNPHGFTAKNGASRGAKSIPNTSGNTERDGVNAHALAIPKEMPTWPPHKRPDMERDKYGPLPNTNLPPMKA